MRPQVAQLLQQVTEAARQVRAWLRPEEAAPLPPPRAWLFRQPKVFLAGAAAGLLLIGWILYIPPAMAIHRSHGEWAQLNRELSDVRRVIDQIRQKGVPPLPPVNSLPTVLEQLNNLARSKQIQFLQVSPGTPRSSDTPGLVILPVELHMEGGYRSLGEFLGALARDPSSLGAAFVRRLTIDREERLLPRLRARLSLELALSEASNGS